MSVNNNDLGLSFNQAATLLNNVVQQASGSSALAAINAADAVSVFTMALRNGYTPTLNAISQVLGRTIFSIRPYTGKLISLDVDTDRWGIITRKLQMADREVMNDTTVSLTDGQTYTPWLYRKPHVIQTNVYGKNMYQDCIVEYKNQLDAGLRGANEFANFMAMVYQNELDKLEQYKEGERRTCLLNLIGGTVSAATTNSETSRVRHLLTEYQAATGADAKLTIEELFGNVDNLRLFAGWFYAEYRRAIAMMGERTTLYHTLPVDSSGTKYQLKRHTPVSMVKSVMYRNFFDQLQTRVAPGTYHDGFLSEIDYEGVNFWQAATTPEGINLASATFFDTSANKNDTTASSAVTADYVLGVTFDKDAAGIRYFDQWQMNTGMDAQHGFANEWFHLQSQWTNDFTENCVVWLLD